MRKLDSPFASGWFEEETIVHLTCQMCSSASEPEEAKKEWRK